MAVLAAGGHDEVMHVINRLRGLRSTPRLYQLQHPPSANPFRNVFRPFWGPHTRAVKVLR
jgi:hypothetical protein